MEFRGEKFRGLLACTAYYRLSLQPIAEKTFADRHKTAKFAKVFSLENFLLYSIFFVVFRWFRRLCSHHGVSGQAYYFYKPVGKGRTVGVRPERALENLKEGLCDPSMAFIYHCYNHYFCPIGFEEVPKKATDAYRYR